MECIPGYARETQRVNRCDQIMNRHSDQSTLFVVDSKSRKAVSTFQLLDVERLGAVWALPPKEFELQGR